MYKIQFNFSLEKFLKSLPKKDLRLIIDKIKSLAINPRPNGYIKLSGREGYRVRVGNYRILYTINDGELIVLVVNIDDRKDVYR